MNEELKPQLDNQFAGTLMQHSQYPAKIINKRKLRKNLPRVWVTRDYLHCIDCYQVWHTSTKRDIISSVVMSNTSGEKQAPPSYTENKELSCSQMFCCLERNIEKVVCIWVIYLHQTEIWKSSFLRGDWNTQTRFCTETGLAHKWKWTWVSSVEDKCQLYYLHSSKESFLKQLRFCKKLEHDGECFAVGDTILFCFFWHKKHFLMPKSPYPRS